MYLSPTCFGPSLRLSRLSWFLNPKRASWRWKSDEWEGGWSGGGYLSYLLWSFSPSEPPFLIPQPKESVVTLEVGRVGRGMEWGRLPIVLALVLLSVWTAFLDSSAQGERRDALEVGRVVTRLVLVRRCGLVGQRLRPDGIAGCVAHRAAWHPGRAGHAQPRARLFRGRTHDQELPSHGARRASEWRARGRPHCGPVPGPALRGEPHESTHAADVTCERTTGVGRASDQTGQRLVALLASLPVVRVRPVWCWATLSCANIASPVSGIFTVHRSCTLYGEGRFHISPKFTPHVTPSRSIPSAPLRSNPTVKNGWLKAIVGMCPIHWIWWAASGFVVDALFKLIEHSRNHPPKDQRSTSPNPRWIVWWELILECTSFAVLCFC